METKVLTKLLQTAIETNRKGTYCAGFRYTKDHTNLESLAIDVYKEDENFMHNLCYTNEELEIAVRDFNDCIKDKILWNVYYRDEFLNVDVNVGSKLLAESKAFALMQRYGIDCKLTEVRNGIL